MLKPGLRHTNLRYKLFFVKTVKHKILNVKAKLITTGGVNWGLI